MSEMLSNSSESARKAFIRAGKIRVAGFCARVRGHGTAGGRLYTVGDAA